LGETYNVESTIVIDNYIQAVRFMGFVPIILSKNPTDEEINFFVQEIDGLILQGGSNSSIEQRNAEFIYIKNALFFHIPIIGICQVCKNLMCILVGN
jgi:Predicted glutamine amidotransferases